MQSIIVEQKKWEWQHRLANSFTCVDTLLEFVGVEPEALYLPKQLINFPFRVTREYAQKIEKGNPTDPLLLQVLPLMNEQFQQNGFVADPLQEQKINLMPGILKRYHGRVLLILTSACPINCRFCFRREFPYRDNQLRSDALMQALAYIKADSSIEEVIFSGGEPLLLSDEKLAKLTKQIAEIPHITRLRIHTRIPVVLPQRITQTLTSWLGQTRLLVTIVLHCNHANELDKTSGFVLKELLPYATLLNQAVLLAGVNDTLDAQIALSHALHATRVIPYYLHLLDPVTGTAHFDVSEKNALQLRKKMLESLPGYLVPRFVRTKSGWKHKQHIQ